jgi:zinc protease
MRIWKPLLAATLVAAAALPMEAQSNLPIFDRKLANGLHVIVIENHAVPLVTVEMDVRNGAYTQSPEFAGLAHLYEHMFFKANRTIPNQEAYLRRLNQLGAVWNGTTSEERVNYFFTLGVDSLVPALQFMEDAIRGPLFQQEELVRERPVVTGEFDRNEANPFFHLLRGIDTLLWSPEYYSRKNVIGDREIILTATTEKMNEIQRTYYVPNNSALILAGDITPERGFALAEQVFGDWPAGRDPFATPIPDPPPLTRSSGVIVERPVNAVTLFVNWQGPSVDVDPAATYAADVLSQILSNPASAFQKRLVDSRLAFGVNVSYQTQAYVGPIRAFVQTTPQNLLAARAALFEEIGKMADENYITPEELAAAQEQLGIQAVQERERTSAWAHTVGFWWAVAGLDYYRTYVPNMQRVTRADIARYVRTYLIGKPYVAGVLISPAARAQINLTPEQLVAQGGAR